jgi:hypothetical protein
MLGDVSALNERRGNMSRATTVARTSLTLSLITGSLATAGAQGIATTRIEAGQGAFQVGYMKLDLSEFNRAITARGYPAIDDGFLSLGGSGYGGPGRWLFGGEGQVLIGAAQETTAGLHQVSMNGGYGMFRFGYNLLNRGYLDLFPSVGLGGGGVAFKIRGRSAPTFDDVLDTPGRSSTMTQGGFTIGFGLSANYRISMPMKDSSRVGGLLIGATAGYVLNPASSGWRLDEINTVAGGPDVRMQGWYARFSFGGWSRGPKRR